MSVGNDSYEVQPGSKNRAHTLTTPFDPVLTGSDTGVRRNKSSAGRMESESFSDKLKKRFNLKRRQS